MSTRIVHLCRTGPPVVGGMETAIAGLIAWQRARGFDVTWITGAPGPEQLGIVRRPCAGVGPLRALGGLGGALAGVGLVHVHGVDGLLAQALALRPPGARIAVSTHGGFLHRAPGSRLRRALMAAWRPLLALADAVWFSSEADAETFAAAGVRGEVVPNGVVLPPWRPTAPAPGRWVVPGRIDRHKGHAGLLRTLAALAAAEPERPWTVDVVGRVEDPALGRSLRRLGRDLGLGPRLRWVGEVSAEGWDRALSSAEVALFPSGYEGFGIAVVEALGRGVPALAQPIAAHRTLLGGTGLLVDLQGGEASLPALRAALATADGVRGAPARALAARWSWEVVGPRWDTACRALGVEP